MLRFEGQNTKRCYKIAVTLWDLVRLRKGKARGQDVVNYILAEATLPLRNLTKIAAGVFLRWALVTMDEHPLPKKTFVSVIIPCRNEEAFIGKCLDSIIANDYPKESLEVLVIDGISEDNTRTIVEEYRKRYSFIKLLYNPHVITPAAFNIGIANAKGDVVVIIGAHATYAKDYISKCASSIKKYNVDNVGGVLKMVPKENTILAKAFAFVLSSPFGGGGSYRTNITGSKPRWVDTVFGGCYKKEIFKKVGLFNENLIRSQDIEFNIRLKKAGGKILLLPDIVAYYYPETNLKGFVKHNFADGIWAVYPIRFMMIPLGLRHYVPLIFVLGIIATGLFAGFWEPYFFWVLAGMYLGSSLYFASLIAWRERNVIYIFLMPLFFALRHLCYGVGSVWGIVRLFQWSPGSIPFPSLAQMRTALGSKREHVPFVSVIVPCRNEEMFIERCLDSIIANDYPKECMEVFVVDGLSEDRTSTLVDQYAKRYPFIRLLSNPKKFTPSALNIGIRAAKGSVIIKMDAHTVYEKSYISKCVEYMQLYNVDNVGGSLVMIPRESTIIAKSIAFTLSHVFGSGDSIVKRKASKPQWADTVAFGCYRREVFNKIGFFNENLIRSQDMEFNRRLQKAGGKILFSPDIIGYYYSGASLKEFWKHNFIDGIWATYPLKFSGIWFPLRHFVPGFFIVSFFLLLFFSFTSPVFLYAFLALLGGYALLSLFASLQVALREKDFKYVLFMPIVFSARHISYGTGSLWGFMKVLLNL